MIKAQKIKERNRILNILVIVIDTIVLVRVLFNFAMTLNNGWDDLKTSSLMLLISGAMVAFFLSVLNNSKYKGHPSYVLGSVIVLSLATLFFLYVLIAVSFSNVTGV